MRPKNRNGSVTVVSLAGSAIT